MGGLGIVLIGLPIFLGTLASRKDSETWRLPESMRPRALVPATQVGSDPQGEEPATITLALGGVRLRVAASDRYDVSVDEETFLVVESDSTGLLVSCDVAAEARTLRTSPLVATISQNTVTYTAPGVRTLRRDPHTILVVQDNAEVFRVHYLDSRTLEIDGAIHVRASQVSLREGIAWPGHFIPPGPVDLAAQGPGRIDLQPSGLLRVVPR